MIILHHVYSLNMRLTFNASAQVGEKRSAASWECHSEVKHLRVKVHQKAIRKWFSLRVRGRDAHLHNRLLCLSASHRVNVAFSCEVHAGLGESGMTRLGSLAP